MFGKSTTSGEGAPASLQKLAKSGEVQQLMSMLQQNTGEGNSLQDAAKSASKGDTTALLGMVQKLMSSEEGATLISNIQQKAKDEGIE